MNGFFTANAAVANTNLNFQTDFQNRLINGACEHKNTPQRQAARLDCIQSSLQLLGRYALSSKKQFAKFIGLFIDLLDFAFEHLHAFLEGNAALADNAHDLEHVFLDYDVVLQ